MHLKLLVSEYTTLLGLTVPLNDFAVQIIFFLQDITINQQKGPIFKIASGAEQVVYCDNVFMQLTLYDTCFILHIQRSQHYE